MPGNYSANAILNAAVLLAFFCISADETVAQPALEISHAAKCAACRVTATPIANFGSEQDRVLIDPGVPLAIDSRERVFAVGNRGAQVAVFDPSGRFLNSFGGKGDGPGEFAGAGARLISVARGDTIIVVDGRNRMIVFSPTFQHVRTVPVGGRIQSVGLLQNGSLLISASIPTPDRAGFPFHELTTSGIFARSFGPARPVVAPGSNTMDVGSFVLSGDRQSMWFQTGDYGAEQFRLDGRRALTFNVVGASWMSGGAAILDTVVNGRAYKVASGGGSSRLIRADSAGLLWFTVVMPVGTQTPQQLLANTLAGRRSPMQFRLEIVDTRSRQILVSHPMEFAINSFIGTSDIACTIGVDSLGVTRVSTWRLAFKRQ